MLRRPVSGLAESAGDGGYGGGDVGSGVGGDGEDEEGVLVVGRVVIVERGLDDGDVEVGEEGGGGHPCQAIILFLPFAFPIALFIISLPIIKAQKPRIGFNLQFNLMCDLMFPYIK